MPGISIILYAIAALCLFFYGYILRTTTGPISGPVALTFFLGFVLSLVSGYLDTATGVTLALRVAGIPVAAACLGKLLGAATAWYRTPPRRRNES